MSSNSGLVFSRRWTWLLEVVAILVCFLFVAPLLWMVITSLKVDSQVFHWPPIIAPSPVTLANYGTVLVVGHFIRYLLNTVGLSVVVVIGNLVSSSLVAYGLSRIRWKGRDVVFIIVLSTMVLPDATTIVPLYVVYRSIGIIGAGYLGYLPLALPYWFAKAYYVFLLRQFFLGIPFDLSQAAKIDGCSEVGILWRIVMPLAKPAYLAMTLYVLLDTWRNFLAPLVYLSNEKYYTVSVGLAELQGRFITHWNQVMAGSAVTVIPVVIIFFFAQRQFVQGISLTGLK